MVSHSAHWSITSFPMRSTTTNWYPRTDDTISHSLSALPSKWFILYFFLWIKFGFIVRKRESRLSWMSTIWSPAASRTGSVSSPTFSPSIDASRTKTDHCHFSFTFFSTNAYCFVDISGRFLFLIMNRRWYSEFKCMFCLFVCLFFFFVSVQLSRK